MGNIEKVIGIIGPSGIGKGYSKEVLKEKYPNTLTEPVIATTRPKRSSDGKDRLAGLSTQEFREMIESGHVVFEHQPFGEESHWYGFVSTSLEIEGSILLTEIHVDNVGSFKAKYGPQIILIAIIGDINYLRSNMERRGVESDEDLVRRLYFAEKEIKKIELLADEGFIDHVLIVSETNKDELRDMICTIATRYM